jgi:hypothetical protein
VNLPAPPRPLPELVAQIQGPHKGSGCRVAIYQLVDYLDGLTFKRAQSWARRAVEREERCDEERASCSR